MTKPLRPAPPLPRPHRDDHRRAAGMARRPRLWLGRPAPGQHEPRHHRQPGRLRAGQLPEGDAAPVR